MEPVKWFIDKEGSRSEHSVETNSEEEGQRETQRLLEDTALRSPTATADDRGGASETRSGQGEASSHNSVDDLLRRIARDVSARQARADSSGRSRHRESSNRNSGSSSDHVTESRPDDDTSSNNGRRRSQQHQPSHRPSQSSTRRSRWGSTPGHNGRIHSAELGASARRGSGDGREREAAAPGAAAAVSVAEANPFTESMWEDASCRQVLQAMCFAPDSAVPAGSTEEYKELEGGTPRLTSLR